MGGGPLKIEIVLVSLANSHVWSRQKDSVNWRDKQQPVEDSRAKLFMFFFH